MMPSTPYRSPLSLLQELGIAEPEDIRIEAIAEHCGATIVYRPLTGCEARIVGYSDKAIITVNEMSSLRRQRFSAGHELGHWMCDRGKIAFACTETTFVGEWSEGPEQRANRYAADLLLPEFMFRQRAVNRPITFATVRQLRDQFHTSLTATAIRLVELGSFPAMIVCNEKGRRRWFMRGYGVPDFWPLPQPGKDTVAYALLQGAKTGAGPVNVSADNWIDHPDSYKYYIQEDSLMTSPNLVLSLLWWKDERQLLEFDEDEQEEKDVEGERFWRLAEGR